MQESSIESMLTGPILPMIMPCEDSRGMIQTIIEANIRSVQIITSNAGTVRANHYHKNDSHYMYILSGKARYIYRPVGVETPPLHISLDINQLIYTPPMVEHALEFIDDTMFLNITTQSRVQSNYESDIVRVDLYKPFQAQQFT